MITLTTFARHLLWTVVCFAMLASTAALAEPPKKSDEVPTDAPAGSRYYEPTRPTPKRPVAKRPVPRPAPAKLVQPAGTPTRIVPPIAPPVVDKKPGSKKPQRGWHLDLEARTDAPVLIGGHLALELPIGLRISSTFGILPPFFVDMINAVLVSAEAYNQQTGDIIKETLGSSMVWRLHLGFRPFANWGFYIEAGYGLITLGGTTSNDKLLSAAAGQSLPPQVAGQLGSYKVNSSLHMFDAEIGYRWLFAGDHLSFRLAIGFAGTVASQTTVTPVSNPNAINQQFANKAAAYLDNLYRTYIFTPTLSVGFGYRFF